MRPDQGLYVEETGRTALPRRSEAAGLGPEETEQSLRRLCFFRRFISTYDWGFSPTILGCCVLLFALRGGVRAEPML